MRRICSVLVGLAAVAGLASGCTSIRNSLGTSDSSCYLSLPTASAAVHSHGRLIGVHRMSLSTLKSKAPHLYADLSGGGAASAPVCVVAYTGSFDRDDVSKPLGSSSGKLAVVVTRASSNSLVGTVIFKKSPLHFGHPHIG
jgi:hypothetical protein